MRILLLYDNFIRDYRGLLLLREALRRGGHEAWVEPLWNHPEITIRIYDPDTVIMGQIGEETTSKIALFVRRHRINLVINTTEYVCNEHKKDNFFKSNFREWNESHIDMQVIVNRDYDQHIKHHKEIKDKSKYKFIGCPRFDLSVHPEICAREKQSIRQKYQLDRFNRKYLYISSFIFDESGGQVSKENLKDIDAAFLYRQEQEQKKMHDVILRELIKDAQHNNDVLLIKRHPWDKSNFYPDNYADAHVVLVENHDYIVPLLQLSDVVLHTESTVAIEGWIQGRKTISVLPHFDGDRSKLKNNMHFEPIARDYAEIKTLIETYPFSETRRSLQNFEPFLDGKATLRLAELIDGLPPRPAHTLFHVTDEEKEAFRRQQIAERLKTANFLNQSKKNDYEYLHRHLDQFRRPIDEMYLEPIRRFVSEQMPRTLHLPDGTQVEPSAKTATLKEMVRECMTLIKTERHSEAVAFLKRVIAVYPDCSSAYFVLAKAFSAVGDFAAATSMYRQAAKLAPENCSYQVHLAEHLFGTNNDIEDAVAICKGIYKSRPDHVDNLWLLTRIGNKLHGVAGGIRFAKAILEIEPSHPQALDLVKASEKPQAAVMGDEPYRIITADDDLGNVLRQAQVQRFDKWCVHFRSLRIYCQDLLAFYIAAKDIFLQEIYSFKTDTAAPRVIDGGGHLGLFTLYVKSQYPSARMTIFEPDGLSLSLLRKNLSANGIQGIEVVEAGLLDREGSLSFRADGSDGGSIFSGKPNCDIQTVRLGRYLNDTIDFLKLNIEGAEYAVIKDIEASLDRVGQMVIEYHGFPEIGQQLHHILSILDRAGFRYLIHDFDQETNPGTKPPFGLSRESRFFLLIYAKRMALHDGKSEPARSLQSRVMSAQLVDARDSKQKGLSSLHFYENEFIKQHAREIRGQIAIVGDNVPQTIIDAAKRNKAVIEQLTIDPQGCLAPCNDGNGKQEFDSISIWELPDSREHCMRLMQCAMDRLRADGTLLVMTPGVCSPLHGHCLKPTDRALEKLIQAALPGRRLQVTSYGNVAAAKWLMSDPQVAPLAPELLRFTDPDYQLAVGATVGKGGAGGGLIKSRVRKRLLIYTLWRSGTHWIANLISEIIGIPWEYTDGTDAFSEIKACLDNNAIAVRHLSHAPDAVLQWAELLDFDILFVWRDIRDVIASNVNMRKYVEGHRVGLPPFPDMEVNDILKWEIEHYAPTYLQLLPAWIQTLNARIHQIRYESMVSNPQEAMRSVLDFIQLDIGSFRLEEILQKYSFKKVAGRESGVEKKNSHYRKGVVGDWKSQFDHEGCELISGLFALSWFASAAWDLKALQPISKKFGFDRGKPIDRIFIEQFLKQKSGLIRGRVLEIADNTYTKTFGSAVECSDVLNVQAASGATIIGDLATGQNIPAGLFDCIIMTQTLNVVYEVHATLKNAYMALKPGGVLLLTVPGVSQVSRYDMDRWGDYWRFSSHELQICIDEAMPGCACRIESFGNPQIANAFLDGLAAQELPATAFDGLVPEYAILQTAEIHKPGNASIQPARDKSIPVLAPPPLGPRILLYHRVSDDALDPQMLSVSPALFEAHLKELAQGYRVIPLSEMVEALRAKKLAPKTVAITFDDGYGDNLTLATPLLEKYELPATVFVTAGILHQKCDFWWDKLECILLRRKILPAVLDLTARGVPHAWSTVTPRLRIRAYHQLCPLLKQLPSEKIAGVINYMTQWASVGRGSDGPPMYLDAVGLKKLSDSPVIEIGAHSMTHPRLASLSANEQKREIEASKGIIEEIIGRDDKSILLSIRGNGGFFGDDSFTGKSGWFRCSRSQHFKKYFPSKIRCLPCRVCSCAIGKEMPSRHGCNPLIMLAWKTRASEAGTSGSKHGSNKGLRSREQDILQTKKHHPYQHPWTRRRCRQNGGPHVRYPAQPWMGCQNAGRQARRDTRNTLL
jgi:surface carbohydrate biosynthesis protein/FkbM family methyltransferase